MTNQSGGRRRWWPARATTANGSPGGLHFGVHVLALGIVRVVCEVLFDSLGGKSSAVAARAAGDPSAGFLLGHVGQGERRVTGVVGWGRLGPVCVVCGGMSDFLKVGRRAGVVVEGRSEIESNLGWFHQPS